MLRKVKTFLVVAIMMSSFTACAQPSETINTGAAINDSKNEKQQQANNDVKSIVIAYLPNESSEELGEYRKGIAKDMETALGVKVTEFLASDYNATIEAMRTGKADIANFGPLSYTQAVSRAKAECIVAAAPNGNKEEMGYSSYIVTQGNNAEINSIEDLEGKKFGFVDANSTSGNLVPSFYILQTINNSKLTFDDLHTNGKFFESVSFTGKHQNGLQAVIKGDIDAAPVASDILEREFNENRADKNAVKIIFKSPKIPGSPVAIRGDLPEEFKQKVKEFYLNYDNEEYFDRFVGLSDGKPQRYVEVTDEDYKEIMALKEKFGM